MARPRASALVLSAACLASALVTELGAEVVMLNDSLQAPEAVSACSSNVSLGRLAGRGLADLHLAGSGGVVGNGTLTIKHNAGMTAFDSCKEEWSPESISQLKLLGKSIGFTVDLSEVGCACNLAFYLISMPARDWEGKLHAGTDRGGQPKYYCDANQVGGQWCPEVDIMEANNHALQSTLHKCDAPQNGHYSYCDRSGCAQSTNEKHGSYGPGSRYTIDTTRPFRLETEFPAEGGMLLGMRAVLRQDERRVVLAHEDCDREYLAALTAAMRDGMSLRITYWGDSAETMAWMDRPVCGDQACKGRNAGAAVISDLSVTALPPAPQSQAARPTQSPWWPPAEGSPAAGPLTERAAAEEHWVPDASAPWECHHYVGDQQETLWCAGARIQGGYEYNYNAGQASPCGGCWCCKRKAKEVLSVWVFSDHSDALFGQRVPDEVVRDPVQFTQQGEHGIASWQGDRHFARRMPNEKAETMNMFLKRFSAGDFEDDGHAPARWGAAFAAAAAGAALLAVATLGAVVMRLRAGRAPASEAAVAASATSAGGPLGVESSAEAGAGGNAAVMTSASSSSPLRRKRSGLLAGATSGTAGIRRAGSSCQKLLSFMSQELDA